jgi:hypothetical protein
MAEIEKYPTPPTGTQSCQQYFADSKASLALLGFVLDTIMVSDFTVAVAKQALEGPENLKIRSPGELAKTSPGPRTLHIRKNSQLFLELFLARLVDNFQCFIVAIIREVLNVQPRVLVNAQPSLSLEYVFQFQNLDELRSDVVESKVNDLSYQGFLKLKQWCVERNIPIIVELDSEQRLIELISIRNIISHNRGIIDKKYLRTVLGSKFELGQRREITVDELFEAEALLNRVVAETDVAIQAKFGLPSISISTGTNKPSEE